jgi:hypothetical protein
VNKARRKLIEKLISDIENAISELDTIRDEETDAFDGMPESLQQSEKGDKAQEAISNLEDAYSSLESARDALENAKE